MTAAPPPRLVAALADRYKIERELGVGGMATVYLAEDLRHARKVAVKVLKPELAAVIGAERFIAEIRTTAALQHPHILPLFDSGEADSFLYYVMPFVDGETLRNLLDRESMLGVDAALQLTAAIADALQYAHDHGVIHRDIKPENILIANGRPVVADFGIALAVSAAAGGRMTETGLSLGTPHYMSPEQATAEKDITARSDQYALACVLYEMLAGQPPHDGGSAQQVIMKIITEVPADLTTRRKTVPAYVAAAVEQALEKLPADRFDSMRTFAAALAEPNSTARTTRARSVATPVGGGSRTYALVGATALLFAVAAWGWLRPTPTPSVLRYELPIASLANASSFSTDLQAPLSASDGSFLVYAAPRTGDASWVQLYRKSREQASGTPIEGSEYATSFALSPDERWIAFTANSQLRKVPVSGGVPEVLVSANVYGPGGVAWLEDGSLLFGKSERGLPVLTRIGSDGGVERVVFESRTGAAVLPVGVQGTDLAFFGNCSSPTTCDLHVINLQSGESRQVLKGVLFSAWSTTGHLVYVQTRRLMAVAFDTRTMQMRGEPIEMATGLSDALSPIRLSTDGTLITRIGSGALMQSYEMVWLDRNGRTAPLDSSWQFALTAGSGNVGWALSPDATRLAIGLATEAGDNVWVRTLPDGPLSRLSVDGGPSVRPRWTADGQSVIYVRQGGGPGVVLRSAQGTGQDSMLLTGLVDEAVLSPDGTWLLVRDGASGSVRGGRDIRGLRIGVDTSLAPLIATRFDEQAVTVSPDGRWVAYHADETGRNEVFVRSFPRTDDVKRQLSSTGGSSPLWSRDGRELFFVNENQEMMSAAVVSARNSDTPIQFARPVPLFRIPDNLLNIEYAFYTPWDVAPDGRFLMARSLSAPGGEQSRIVVAENWFTELKEKLARVKR